LENKIDIQISDKPLSEKNCLDFVSHPGAGGIVNFIGTVRNQTQGKAVIKLEFEAYVPMAISEMRKIAERATEKWPVQKMAIHHRVGTLAITIKTSTSPNPLANSHSSTPAYLVHPPALSPN